MYQLPRIVKNQVWENKTIYLKILDVAEAVDYIYYRWWVKNKDERMFATEGAMETWQFIRWLQMCQARVYFEPIKVYGGG